jgi:hypothetical protein
MNTLKTFINLLVEQKIVLTESKQNIMNLGYPEIVSSILLEAFGKNSFTIAKWYRDYYSYKFYIKSDTQEYPKNWWWILNRDKRIGGDFTLSKLVNLYDSIKISKEAYLAAKDDAGFHVDDDEIYEPSELLQEWKDVLKTEILDKEIFFKSVLINDLKTKKIKDINAYKNLSFNEAQDKYDEKRVFADQKPIKQYSNGWKWIDVGPKCQLVGKLMRNCGSAGVMSRDDKRTILTLFDDNHNPHVLVTYSPNQNRISGDQGGGGSEVKEEYQDYEIIVIDNYANSNDENLNQIKIK